MPDDSSRVSPAPRRGSCWLVAIAVAALLVGGLRHRDARARADRPESETPADRGADRLGLRPRARRARSGARSCRRDRRPSPTRRSTPARTGTCKKWYVDIGARVRKGQLLADIDSPEIEQQLQAAKADLATAEANEHLAKITADRYARARRRRTRSRSRTRTTPPRPRGAARGDRSPRERTSGGSSRWSRSSGSRPRSTA